MNPFTTFSRLFPLTDLQVEKDALRRTFESDAEARYFEQEADKIILGNGLPLVASIETWSRRGIPFEINLVVEMAPEEYEVADEAGDNEGLDGGWWNVKSE